MIKKRDLFLIFLIASALGVVYLPFWEHWTMKELIRYSTAVFMSSTFYLFSSALGRAWHRMWRFLRRAAIWIYLFIAVSIWRTLEALAQEAPIGASNYAVLGTMVGFTIALMLRFKNDFSTERIYTFPWTKESR